MSNRQPLTQRQEQVLAFIRECLANWGYPPTLREIGAHLGIASTNGVADHIKALRRKGYLRQQDAKSRTWIPTDTQTTQTDAGDRSVVDVPVLGRVAAGVPILAFEEYDAPVLHVDEAWLGCTQEVFALTVQGDSMVEAHVCPGDTVFVKRVAKPPPHSIVVALWEDVVTLKRYVPTPQGIRLQPANRTMQPIELSDVQAQDLRILGVVVGVWRRVTL